MMEHLVLQVPTHKMHNEAELFQQKFTLFISQQPYSLLAIDWNSLQNFWLFDLSVFTGNT